MTLLFGSVSLDDAPASIAENMPPIFPVPVMILARWAVDKNEQRQGIGTGLLKEALLKTLAAADIAGLRAIVVDANQ
jgi:predicted N-acetyltransferase YhbS